MIVGRAGELTDTKHQLTAGGPSMWIAIARSNLRSVLVMSNFGSALPVALLALGGMLTFRSLILRSVSFARQNQQLRSAIFDKPWMNIGSFWFWRKSS